MLAHGLGLPYYGSPYLTDLEQIAAIVGNNEGAVFDVASAFNRNAIWEDSARTTPASVDGPVGSIQDELERYYAEQATGAARPILRTDGAGAYWLESDGTKFIRATFALNQPWERVSALWVDSWVAGRQLIGGVSSNSGVLFMDTAPPKVRRFDGISGTIIDMPISGWFVAEESGNSPNSRLSINNGSAAISDTGTNAVSGITLLGSFSGAGASGRIAAVAMSAGLLTDGQRAVFRQWAASRCVNNPL